MTKGLKNQKSFEELLLQEEKREANLMKQLENNAKNMSIN
jgi:hypothetical protein